MPHRTTQPSQVFAPRDPRLGSVTEDIGGGFLKTTQDFVSDPIFEEEEEEKKKGRKVRIPKDVLEEGGVTIGEGGRISAPEGGGVIVGADGRVSFLDPSGSIFEVGKDGKKKKVEPRAALISPTKEPGPGQAIEEKVGGLRDETEGFLVEESEEQIRQIQDKTDQARNQQVSRIRQARNQQGALQTSINQLASQADRFRRRAAQKKRTRNRASQVEAVRLVRLAEDLEGRAQEMTAQAEFAIPDQIRQAQVSMADAFRQGKRATEAEVNQTSLRIRAKRVKDSEVGPKSTKAIDTQLRFTRQELADVEKVLGAEVKRFNNIMGKQAIEARVDPSDPSSIGVFDTKTGEAIDAFKGVTNVQNIKRLRAAQTKFTKLKEQEDRFRIMSFGEPPKGTSLTEWLGLVRDMRNKHGLATQEAVETLRSLATQITTEQQALGLR